MTIREIDRAIKFNHQLELSITLTIMATELATHLNNLDID